MHKAVTVSMMSVFGFFALPNFIISWAYMTLFFMIYVVRVCFCRYIEMNFEERMFCGIFSEILWLENYLLLMENRIKNEMRERKWIRNHIDFYKMGLPEPVDPEALFMLWNNEAEPAIFGDPESFIINIGEVEFPVERSVIVENRITEYRDADQKYGGRHADSSTEREREANFCQDNETQSQASQSLDTRRVTPSTLQRCFSEKEAEEIFRIISFNRERKLNWKTFKENVGQINKERSNLYSSINDFYALMLKVQIGAMLLQVASYTSLLFRFLGKATFVTTLCLPFFLFIMFPSLEHVCNSIFFILMSNPFNSGDRVIIDGENMLVKKMALLSSRFERWNGEHIVVVNRRISESTIQNIMRSGSQQWNVELVVNVDTPMKKLEDLRYMLKRFAARERAFISVEVASKEIMDSRYLKLAVFVKHRKNHQMGFISWMNHNKLMKKLVSSLRSLNIQYYPLERPVRIEGWPDAVPLLRFRPADV